MALTERRNLFKQVAASLAVLGRRGRGVFLFQGPVSSRVKNLFYGRELAARVELVIRVRYGKQGIEGLLQHRPPWPPVEGSLFSANRHRTN